VTSPATPSAVDAESPARRSRAAVTLFLCLFVAALAADLTLKSWAFHHYSKVQPPDVLIPSVLAIKLTENRGAVFGLWQGQRAVFIVASVIAVAAVGWFFATSRARDRWLHIALALILAGALGNLYDRLTLQHVRDMLYLFPDIHLPFGWAWPGGATDLYPWIFNLADVYLTIGILLVMAWTLVDGRREQARPETDRHQAPGS